MALALRSTKAAPTIHLQVFVVMIVLQGKEPKPASIDF
jgi:hypothetical protein